MKIEEHSIRDIPRRRFLELGIKGGYRYETEFCSSDIQDIRDADWR